MRNFAVTLILICLPSFAIGADFSGMWFACYAGMGFRYPIELLEILREGTGYRWLSEWGTTHTASGKGYLRGDRLILRGCKSDRSQIEQGCDESNPPVYLVMDGSMLTPNKSSLKESLRRSKWIKTDEKTWEWLNAECEALQEATINRKNPESKK